MSFIPADVQEAAKKMGGKFIKAAEFEGDGLVLQCVSVEKVKSNNPKFGANDKDGLYKQEILGEGETFRYVFKTNDGEERVLESKSAAAFIGFNNAELEAGDWIRVSKTGKMDDTRYNIEKTDEAPAVGHRGMAGVEYPTGPNPEDVPF